MAEGRAGRTVRGGKLSRDIELAGRALYPYATVPASPGRVPPSAPSPAVARGSHFSRAKSSLLLLQALCHAGRGQLIKTGINY